MLRGCDKVQGHDRLDSAQRGESACIWGNGDWEGIGIVWGCEWEGPRLGKNAPRIQTGEVIRVGVLHEPYIMALST